MNRIPSSTPKQFPLPNLGLLLFLLSGCTPLPSNVFPVLPAPQVWITPHISQTPAIMATQGAAGNPSPTNIVITLQELAIETYGNRLILQINIPVINVTSPVITVGWRSESISGLQDELTSEWDSPGAAVGWVLTSALPGQTGNIILYGHNNLYGSIFKDLGNLSTGDGITLTTGQGSWEYHVDQSLLLPILSSDEEGRRAYQAYLQPTTAPRLTIISCWPPESNTHRVVIIAYPVYVP